MRDQAGRDRRQPARPAFPSTTWSPAGRSPATVPRSRMRLRGATAYRSEVDFRHPVLGLPLPAHRRAAHRQRWQWSWRWRPAQDVTAVEARQPRIEVHEQLFSNWLEERADVIAGNGTWTASARSAEPTHPRHAHRCHRAGAGRCIWTTAWSTKRWWSARSAMPSPTRTNSRVIRPDGRVRWIHSAQGSHA